MARNKKDKDLLGEIYGNLDISATAFNSLYKEMKDDFRFAQGEQWDPVDVEELKKAGVKALTINKIKPIIKLIAGLERQSRSDFVALPEGGEDQITGDIATRLMKNVTKMSKVERKHSEQFKHGAIAGLSYIEPYMDYSQDLIEGTLQFKKISAMDIFPDPDAQEYDFSDGKFMIKVTRNLSRDELIELFPDKKSKIENMENGSIHWESVREIVSVIENDRDYEPHFDQKAEVEKGVFDLIDYYYKKLEDKFYVAIREQGRIDEMPSKEEAENLVATLQAQGVEAVVISKMVPVIRQASVVGNEIFEDDKAWFYPRWKRYHFLPFFAEETTEKLGDKSINVQGIVRSIKDLQEEFNKRRTQELRHLNSSANSGFDVEEGQLNPNELAKLKKYGSSAGVVIQRKRGSQPIMRITPMPLSQGHVQLAEENQQDMKEASGVNPDLLASDSKSQSGRAILLKQRQGLVMIQEMLDNFGETKRLTGQFILSQFKEIYTVESALKVLGDAWIADNFTVPVNIVLERGLTKVANGEEPSELEKATLLKYPQNDPAQPILSPDGNALEPVVDFDTAILTVNRVLNDAEIGRYDVAVGEGPYTETINMANFLDIKDLAQQGVPIPLDVIIELSGLPEAQKKKIIRGLQQQQEQAQKVVKEQANEQTGL